VRGAPVGYDPANKTGLLPRDGRTLVEGNATYVVGGTKAGFRAPSGFPSRSGRYNDPLGGYAAPNKEKEKQDSKKRKAQKEAEESHLLAILQRDDNKSIGAKYLSKNTDRAASKKARMEDEGEEAAVKKRVFTASSLRAIGFDPTSSAIRDEDETSKRRRVRFGLLGCYLRPLTSFPARSRVAPRCGRRSDRTKARTGSGSGGQEVERGQASR
jgi:hypothetical protein